MQEEDRKQADDRGRPCRLFAGVAPLHPEALSKGHVHAVTGEWVRAGAVWEEVACMCKCASAVEREVEQKEGEEEEEEEGGFVLRELER